MEATIKWFGLEQGNAIHLYCLLNQTKFLGKPNEIDLKTFKIHPPIVECSKFFVKLWEIGKLGVGKLEEFENKG